METKFVKVSFDLDCEWSDSAPAYRIYVNDELFVERTWIWRDYYLQEMLQISAEPGRYLVRVESLSAAAKFTASNHCIAAGPAEWDNNNNLVILNES